MLAQKPALKPLTIKLALGTVQTLIPTKTPASLDRDSSRRRILYVHYVKGRVLFL